MVMKTTDTGQITAMHLQRDIDALRSGRKISLRTGRDTSVVSAQIVLRELPPSSPPMLFLFHAPKKTVRSAVDRNKLKRWMREAVRRNEDRIAYAQTLQEAGKQALILLRITEPPSKNCTYQKIVSDCSMIFSHLINAV
jgi:ribonuclease P protein component